MLITSKEKIREIFRHLKVMPGDDIMLHSSLVPFGKIEGSLDGFYDAVRDHLGQESTIIAPTFTLSFQRNQPFDIQETPSAKSIGCFSEFLRKRPNAVRSACPLFSMVAEGPKASYLMRRDSINCFGVGSI